MYILYTCKPVYLYTYYLRVIIKYLLFKDILTQLQLYTCIPVNLLLWVCLISYSSWFCPELGKKHSPLTAIPPCELLGLLAEFCLNLVNWWLTGYLYLLESKRTKKVDLKFEPWSKNPLSYVPKKCKLVDFHLGSETITSQTKETMNGYLSFHKIFNVTWT